MGILRYKLEKWKKRKKYIIKFIMPGIGIPTIVAIALTIQNINNLGCGTKLAIIILICLLFISLILLAISQFFIHRINNKINREGDH